MLADQVGDEISQADGLLCRSNFSVEEICSGDGRRLVALKPGHPLLRMPVARVDWDRCGACWVRLDGSHVIVIGPGGSGSVR